MISDQLPPKTPTSISMSDISETSFMLSWDKSAFAESYEIEMYDPKEDETEMIM